MRERARSANTLNARHPHRSSHSLDSHGCDVPQRGRATDAAHAAGCERAPLVTVATADEGLRELEAALGRYPFDLVITHWGDKLPLAHTPERVGGQSAGSGGAGVRWTIHGFSAKYEISGDSSQIKDQSCHAVQNNPYLSLPRVTGAPGRDRFPTNTTNSKEFPS